jgi:hypothetical protein
MSVSFGGFLPRGSSLFLARGAGFEFEDDFVFFEFEVGGEGFAFFADEAGYEVGFADGEDFLDLLAGDFFLAQGLAHAEFALADI